MPTNKRTVKHAPIVAEFGERLKAVRLARGMTQRELAEKAHVTFSYISRLEAGGAAPGIDLLQKLAEALGATITDLLPCAPAPNAGGAPREAVTKLFESLLSKAGPETLGMLEVLLARLAESPTAKQ